MKVVEKITLNKTEQNKWFHNLLVFLAPLAALYLTTVVGAVSQAPLTLMDLVPNEVALGGLILWVLNTALDYLRKLKPLT